MAIVIGLVLHETHRPVFEAAARTLNGVTLAWVTYEHDREVRGKVRALLDHQEIDGLLLGPMPYAKSRDLLPPDLPVKGTRSAALDLSLALFRAAAQGYRPVPVSVDTFDQETVEEVSAALDLDGEIACLPYDAGQDVADVVAFHRRFRRRTGADYVISVRTGVIAELGDSVPVLSGLSGPATIRTELHELALRIQSKRASGLRFAAGVFLLAKPEHAADLDRARVGLMNMLLNTPEFADCWIENRDRRGVVVFAHKALFEGITRNWTTLPALAQAQEVLGVRVAAGFGVGSSARTCVTLAERAAGRAEQEAFPCAYLIEDSGVMIGPMGHAAHPGAALSFTYREHGADLEAKARVAGLSPATLSRLAALERGLDGKLISPSDLANSLGITDPSGRRLVRKLVQAGLIVDEGSAQVNRKGRPTRLYRLRIETTHAG
jgi:hypothetical protein